jgi:hypothetical protein
MLPNFEVSEDLSSRTWQSSEGIRWRIAEGIRWRIPEGIWGECRVQLVIWLVSGAKNGQKRAMYAFKREIYIAYFVTLYQGG